MTVKKGKHSNNGTEPAGLDDEAYRSDAEGRITTPGTSDEAEHGTANKNLDPLSIYLREIGKMRRITRDEEIALAKRIEAGGEDAEAAKNELVQAHLRFVVSEAKKFMRPYLSLLDLIQQGNYGLMQAADKYDWRKGSFINYAGWYIRKEVFNYVNGNDILSAKKAQAVKYYQSKQLAFIQAHNHSPSREELAEMLHCSVDFIKKLEFLMLVRDTVSLNQSDESGDDFENTLPDDKADDPENTVMAVMELVQMREAMETLTEREREVLEKYYGLNGRKPRTLKQIAEELHISPERARQIKNEALRKLAIALGV